jgi:hypothetical protein
MRFTTPLNPRTRALAAERLSKAPDGWVMELRDRTRSTEQNSALWAALSDVSVQVEWHGVRLSPEDWKLVFMDALNQEMRLVPNVAGTGFINLGRSSSKLTKQEFSDLIELVRAFGSERGVVWSDDRREAA